MFLKPRKIQSKERRIECKVQFANLIPEIYILYKIRVRAKQGSKSKKNEKIIIRISK